MIYYFFIIWFLINQFISMIFKLDKSLTNNITNLVHALTYIFLYNINTQFTEIISTNFYIYDLLVIIENGIRDNTTIKKNHMYIIHHIIALYIFNMILQDHYLGKFISYQIYEFELSNLSIYFTYHYLKSYKNDTKERIFIIKLFQYFWYSYFRVYLFIHNIYKNNIINLIFNNNDFISAILIIIFILMNVIWSIKLVSNTISTII